MTKMNHWRANKLNDAFHGALFEAESAVINEHFRCGCGHEWSREIEAGLVAIGCPVCGDQHMTSLGRLWAVVVSEKNPARS